MPRPTINDVATRGGRLEGCGLVRAERPARASRRRPGSGSSRSPSSSAGRPARGPGRCRCPRRSPSAWSSPGRPRSCAPTRSSPPSSPASRPCSPTRGHALLLMVAEHDDAATYRRLAQEGRVDGVFVTDLRSTTRGPRCSTELGLPAVVVGPALGDDAERRHRRSASTTPPASAPPSSTSSASATPASRTSSGPQSMVHGRSRATAWSSALRDGRAARGPLRRGRLLRRVRRRGHPRAARPRRAADRDRLRQRPDGDGRAVARGRPRGLACRASSRSPASTTSRSPPTSSRADHGAAPTSSPGAAPPPPGCSS